MEVEGTDVPPPMKRFQDMRFPTPIINVLQKKGIRRPTPIQMQGLPVALASRDMVGIAFTGSGKTLSFSLPLVMAALEEELRMPLVAGEGPIGILLAPARELARQTYDVVDEFCKAISEAEGYPELRCQLLIGGESVRDQLSTLESKGVHCVVATPGRLRDVLKRKSMTLSNCRYICLDEADRMLDLGFDEEVGEIMNYFPHQRQTLLFSATFPKKFQDFARDTLVQPVVVNVGRAGAANLDVIQEVEYVKQVSVHRFFNFLGFLCCDALDFFFREKPVADFVSLLTTFLLLNGYSGSKNCVSSPLSAKDRTASRYLL